MNDAPHWGTLGPWGGGSALGTPGRHGAGMRWRAQGTARARDVRARPQRSGAKSLPLSLPLGLIRIRQYSASLHYFAHNRG